MYMVERALIYTCTYMNMQYYMYILYYCMGINDYRNI